ncbi:MAG: hypothetical protein ACK5BE_05610 [Alphaproteobacteria bacterium]|jgi:hypothetical protein
MNKTLLYTALAGVIATGLAFNASASEKDAKAHAKADAKKDVKASFQINCSKLQIK